MEYQITHIRPDRSDPDHSIEAIYGPLCGLLALDDAIWRIKTNDRFYTQYLLDRTYVRVVPATILRREHLTTSPDGIKPNNLLKLPHV